VLLSGWQLSHEKVPVVEPKALLKAMRPRRTASGVGSLPTGIFVTWTRFAGFETFTTDTVFSRVLST
jgi:hypothetical protein